MRTQLAQIREAVNLAQNDASYRAGLYRGWGELAPHLCNRKRPITSLISVTVLTCLPWLTQSNAATKRGTQMKKIGEGLDD